MILVYRYSDAGSNGKQKIRTKPQFLKNFAEHFFDDKNPLYYIVDKNLPNDHLTILKDTAEQFYHNKDQIHFVFGNCDCSTNSCLLAINTILTLPNYETVYFVEDDYLYKPNAQKILEEGIGIFDYVTLYDHPDKYWVNSPNHLVTYNLRGHAGEDTKVLLSESSHWKLTNSTTMTFACKVSTIKADLDVFKKYCVGQLPQDFAMFLELGKNRSRTIGSPIPGYASHGDVGWCSPFHNV